MSIPVLRNAASDLAACLASLWTVAPIHKFLGGAKIFSGVGEFFSHHHAKSSVSAPPIDSIEVNSCTKCTKAWYACTYIEHWINETNKKILGGILRGCWPPSPTQLAPLIVEKKRPKLDARVPTCTVTKDRLTSTQSDNSILHKFNYATNCLQAPSYPEIKSKGNNFLFFLPTCGALFTGPIVYCSQFLA